MLLYTISDEFEIIRLPRLAVIGRVKNTLFGMLNGLLIKLQVNMYESTGLITGVFDEMYCTLAADIVNGYVPAF
jgi:hypothetical protein